MSLQWSRAARARPSSHSRELIEAWSLRACRPSCQAETPSVVKRLFLPLRCIMFPLNLPISDWTCFMYDLGSVRSLFYASKISFSNAEANFILSITSLEPPDSCFSLLSSLKTFYLFIRARLKIPPLSRSSSLIRDLPKALAAMLSA